jgi:hypothetical protein
MDRLRHVTVARLPRPINWHFARDALAREVLDAYESGAISRGTIYAPRRKGKTEFILRDLIPLARSRGWVAVYANLWDDKDQPHHVLGAAMKEAVLAYRRRNILRRILTAPVNRLKAEGEVPAIGSFSAEVELASNPAGATAEDMAEIRDNLTILARSRKRLLLAVDEIQHLATSPKFERLAFTLRTQLDSLGPRVSVIFTGSSWAGLARTFQHGSMPFYQSAQALPFPDMGKDFVEHTARCYEQLTGRRLASAALMRFFDAHDRSPFHLQSLVKRMAIAGYAEVEQASRDYDAFLAESGSQSRLTPFDSYVLERIEGSLPVFAAEALGALAAQHGIGVTAAKHRVKRALGQLEQQGRIAKTGRGKYQFARS